MHQNPVYPGTQSSSYSAEIKLLSNYIVTIPIVLITSYLFYNVADGNTVILWGKEDSLFEWLTALFYFIADAIRSLIVSVKGDPYILRPPTTQLIALLFSILVFRIMMINWKKENLGKGFLLVIMIAVISYFYIYFRIKNHG